MNVTLSELAASQPHAVAVLDTARRRQRLHHAYLLVGADPAVAHAVALATAQRLVCQAPAEAMDGCAACPPCRQLLAGTHPDVVRLEPNEKGRILVDAVRALTGRLALTATASAVKVAILRDADSMNTQAQNALLKTLEEPPGRTCFLLTASRPRCLLPTVRSRCYRLTLRPASRRGAFRTLMAAGIDARIAHPLAALCGDDVDAATHRIEAGAAEVLDRLEALLTRGGPPEAVLTAASDLAANPKTFEVTLELTEVLVRDSLARAHGATNETLYAPALTESLHLEASTASRTARELQRTRRLAVLNINKTMALETLLSTLLEAQSERVERDPATGRMKP